jgi:hypothetical protein
MARRKKTVKKRTMGRRSKRRMGAVGSNITNALFTIAGGVAARFVSNTINGTSLDESYKGYVAAAAPIAVGLFLPKFIKTPMGSALGAGMVAVGGLSLVQSTGVLSGMPVIARRYMGLGPTTQNTRGVIAGMENYGMDTRQAAVLCG